MAETSEDKLKELAAYAPASVPNKEQYIQLVNQQILGKGKNGEPRPISDLIFFLQVAQTTGLNPLAKQVYAVYRWDSRAGKEVMVIQTGIDGLRSIAEKTGNYAGSDEGKFDYPEPPVPSINYPTRATVTVYKINHITGERMPTTATAQWAEYYPGEGAVGNMWRKLPETMLEKCAEAKALRKAFPNTAQLYVPEEMERAIVGPVETLPSIMDEINAATTPQQLSAIMQRMTVEDRKNSINLIERRLKELTSGN